MCQKRAEHCRRLKVKSDWWMAVMMRTIRATKTMVRLTMMTMMTRARRVTMRMIMLSMMAMTCHILCSR